jgi:hypothetical protein
MPILTNWSVVVDTSNPYRAPELCKQSFKGKVYNHPNFQDGEVVHTGTVIKLDWREKYFETRRTRYWLEGPPDPSYVEFVKENFPEMLEKIL